MKKRYTFLSENWLRFGLVAAFAVSSLISNAQTAPAKVWDKTFGGNDVDRLISLQQTSDGGYILGGYSESGISGDKSQICKGTEDYWLLKLDNQGNKVWDKTIGGSYYDYLTSINQTSDGGYIMIGYSHSGNSADKSDNNRGLEDYWVVKIDSIGNKIWDKTFGGNKQDIPTSVVQTIDGGYLLGGHSNTDTNGDKTAVNKGSINTFDHWLIKIDSNGNKVWDKTIGGSSTDYLYYMDKTSDGGFIIGGASNSPISSDKTQANQGGLDYWIVKLNASGNKIWDRTYGGSNDDLIKTIQQTSDRGYILGGISQSGISGDKSQSSYGDRDLWIIKIDSTGNKQWDKTIGGSNREILGSLIKTMDGSYLINSTSNSPISGDKTQPSQGTDAWLIKIDSLGHKLWDQTIGGSGNENASKLLQLADGSFIWAGDSDSGIGIDKSQPSQGASDYWIVKLAAEVTGTKELVSHKELLISPNPSQGKFNLQLENISASKVEVSVSDLLGRVILQKELPVTNKQISEELEIKASKGMYLLQIKAGNQSTSRKIVVK
ncbi:T9SS type A sorting domain-containing protein [Adhaeribacter terreus]|uniref:T9SS type A sorting domain-containing protein n=1 Tax=Adhaeribacter terreus TaxID=529703 RepID=A0ABW0E7N4_9BACT